MNTNTYVFLHDGYAVPLAFLDSVQQQVEEILPTLKPKARYTAKMLCGTKFWDQLGSGNKKIAGRCLASMVTRNLVPLSSAGRNPQNAKQYQLK